MDIEKNEKINKKLGKPVGSQIGEVGLFLQDVKKNASVLVDLKEIENDSYDKVFSYLAMKNCKHNWYSCGIPQKYKVINRLLKLLKENHKKAQDLQKQVNKLLNEK